jgi:hypothetical protein
MTIWMNAAPCICISCTFIVMFWISNAQYAQATLGIAQLLACYGRPTGAMRAHPQKEVAVQELYA